MTLDSNEGNLKTLLENTKYRIHYYQREYRWQNRQVIQLLDDLLDAFDYHEGDNYENIETYPHYFMGSIIDIPDGKKPAIIDGQQRLTSFSLIIIYLYRRFLSLGQQKDYSDLEHDLRESIISGVPSNKEYNIGFNDEARIAVLKSLFEGNKPGVFLSATAETMFNRYEDIENKLNHDLSDNEVGLFAYWILNNVDFIEITVGSEQDAYRIFVSMNDRGLKLSLVEMLKGYLLSEITDDEKRSDCNKKWNDVISGLLSMNGRKPDDPDNQQDTEFFQQFLRAKYAQTQRETKANAVDADYEKIGSELHQWVFDNRSAIRLQKSSEVVDFIEKTLPFYFSVYKRIVSLCNNLTSGFECLYYNAKKDISYQNMLILASIEDGDSVEEIERKFKLISFFVDRYTNERLFSFKKTNWNTNKYFLFRLMKDLRGKDSKQIAVLLIKSSLDAEKSVGISFDNVHKFHLNGTNKWFVKHVLGRFTAYFDRLLGEGETFQSYMNLDKKQGKTYDIEHILADKFTFYGSNFASEEEFEDYRNRIGNLILLTFDKNRSYQDNPVSEKIKHYYSDNNLAKSLNPLFPEHQPAFKKMKDNFGIHPYDKMEKPEIDERSLTYENMAKTIWSLDHLKKIAGSWTEEDEAEAFEPKRSPVIGDLPEDAKDATHWILACNPDIYDIDEAVKNMPFIPFSRNSGMQVGDVIYLYVSGNVRKLKYRFVVTGVGIQRPEEDCAFLKNKSFLSNEDNMSLKLAFAFGEGIPFDELKQNGLTSNLQSPCRVKDDLLTFLKEKEEEEKSNE